MPPFDHIVVLAYRPRVFFLLFRLDSLADLEAGFPR